MNDKKIIAELECRIAFQEDAIEQLSASLIAQQKQIDQVMRQLEKMHARINSLQEQAVAPMHEETPPPHY
jgi:SlyX protein